MEVEINGKHEGHEGHEAAQKHASLLHRTQESLDLKDFHTEVRGLMDVGSLLETCNFLLDVKVKFAGKIVIYYL